MNIKKTYLFTFYLLAISAVFAGTLLIEGCNNSNTDTSDKHYKLTGNTEIDGKNLVQINCTPCHKLVPVTALPKDIWTKRTLPAMAHYFGIGVYGGTQYFQDHPDSAKLNLQEWQTIIDYYQKIAPAALIPAVKPSPLLNDWAGFTLKMPPIAKEVVFTTMAALNPDNHKIYTADATSGRISEWDSKFNKTPVALLPSPAISALFTKDAAGKNQGIFTCIGRLEPLDFPNGRVVDINLGNGKADSTQNLVADVLARPVQTIEGDFNKDGLTDLLTLGQGHLRGGIYLFTQGTGHKYTKANVSARPGAVQAVAGDFNDDGWLDVMVLFGSIDEGLVLYTNNHKGGFTEKYILRFPPVFGSSSFQLADIDHDGKPDLIYTCGYNYRISRILKPYHGLYIFKNTGNWNFKQQWFYPINGCTKAIAADFDGDGDLDIATSAFFGDMQNNPAESFIYFEQDKPFSFKAHAIPVSKYGHWMSMDVGDYNNDGKPDIILGNYSTGFMFQPDFKPFWSKNLPFIVLQNNTKK